MSDDTVFKPPMFYGKLVWTFTIGSFSTVRLFISGRKVIDYLVPLDSKKKITVIIEDVDGDC